MSPTYCVCCSFQALPENHLQRTPTYSLREREGDGWGAGQVDKMEARRCLISTSNLRLHTAHHCMQVNTGRHMKRTTSSLIIIRRIRIRNISSLILEMIIVFHLRHVQPASSHADQEPFEKFLSTQRDFLWFYLRSAVITHMVPSVVRRAALQEVAFIYLRFTNKCMGRDWLDTTLFHFYWYSFPYFDFMQLIFF